MLDLFQDAVFNTLRVMSTGLRIPVMILLVLLAAYTVFIIGTLMVEIFTEHRHLKVHMPALVDGIKKAGRDNVAATIENSSLLKRQKAALIELTRHPDLTNMMRESLAIRLISQEQDHYDSRTKQTDTIAKIGPMLGLMGTLIPLGPGIIALGQGDTYTLSTSLLTAFDTTVAGLACAAAALVISIIRKRWYKNYMSMTETLMECTLEMENSESVPANETTGPSAASVPSAPSAVSPASVPSTVLDPSVPLAASVQATPSAASAPQAYEAYAEQYQQVPAGMEPLYQQPGSFGDDLSSGDGSQIYGGEVYHQQYDIPGSDHQPGNEEISADQQPGCEGMAIANQLQDKEAPDIRHRQNEDMDADLPSQDDADTSSEGAEPKKRTLSREQQKQILSEAFKKAYIDALQAGYNKEDAIVLAREKALEMLSISIQKAGEQLC